MSGGQGYEAVQEALDAHIGNWEPDEAQEIEDFFAGMGDFWRNQGQTWHHLAERMSSELPIAARVRELVDEVAASCTMVGDHADDTYNAHRTDHEGRLDRLENPMPGEETWNVT
jgi:hypothetical protein